MHVMFLFWMWFQTRVGCRPISESSFVSNVRAFIVKWAFTCPAFNPYWWDSFHVNRPSDHSFQFCQYFNDPDSWTTCRRHSCSSLGTCPTTVSTKLWRLRYTSPSRTSTAPCNIRYSVQVHINPVGLIFQKSIDSLSTRFTFDKVSPVRFNLNLTFGRFRFVVVRILFDPPPPRFCFVSAEEI